MFQPPRPKFYAGVSGRSWKQRIDHSLPPHLAVTGISCGFGGYKNVNIVMRPITGPTPVLKCVPGIPRAAYVTVSASPAGLTALGGLQDASRGRSGQGPHTGSGRPS